MHEAVSNFCILKDFLNNADTSPTICVKTSGKPDPAVLRNFYQQCDPPGLDDCISVPAIKEVKESNAPHDLIKCNFERNLGKHTAAQALPGLGKLQLT